MGTTLDSAALAALIADAVAAGVAAALATAAPAAPVASAPATAEAASQFRTKAQREAGDGFPCTVTPSCGRTDLRTAKSGASHDPKAPHWHKAA